MNAVVTGAAGFIGSHLSEALYQAGHQVLGIDCFTDYYETSDKHRNIEALGGMDNFSLSTADLRSAELEPLLDGADVVFHQAGQPGVRASWSAGFADYVTHNILATQRLLEAARNVHCARFVFASSSSVYGDAVAYPSAETDLPRPCSPYGMTKLAAEHLCSLYAANFGLSTVSLRYFSVFGPRQRPDMAVRRLIDAAIQGEPFPLYGTGEQVRDFTFVRDVVAANLLAGTSDVPPGTVVNIASCTSTSLAGLVRLVRELAERPVATEHAPAQAGDPDRSGGAIETARRALGWAPEVSLRDGLIEQLDWSRQAVRPPHPPTPSGVKPQHPALG